MSNTNWHPCHYEEDSELICDLPDYDFEDGKWYRWIDKTGQIQTARYKQDAIDHFYPPGPLFAMDDVIGFQFLKDVTYSFKLNASGYIDTAERKSFTYEP